MVCVDCGPLLLKRLSVHVFRVRTTAWRTNEGLKFTQNDDRNRTGITVAVTWDCCMHMLHPSRQPELNRSNEGTRDRGVVLSIELQTRPTLLTQDNEPNRQRRQRVQCRCIAVTLLRPFFQD